MKIHDIILGGSLLYLILLACTSSGYPQGERIYMTYCANCHMDDGSGLRKLIPPIAGADYLERTGVDTLVCLILNGRPGGLVVNDIQFNEPMPGFSNLKPAELSNLMNYIRTGFGNNLPPVDPQEVESAYERCIASKKRL